MRKLFLFFLLIPYLLTAQFNEYNPEYDWYTLKGEHVFVHYHPEAERTARTVLKIAEEVWGPITSLYDYEPETVHFVIKDIDDYSNGATYFFDNKIEIWASALDFDLRGSHNWLRNVISHEFTHMVQIQAAMKIGRRVPAVYLQFMNYEDKRRPDILYGFPNFIASYPIATVNVPAWFAEGTAQYMRKEFNYDNWDTHRDMILRCYALDGKMLTWNQMGVFGKTSLGNESVYNAGFALTRYIAQKYGEDKLVEINDRLKALTNFTIDAAIEQTLGISGKQLYSEWSEFLKKDYKERINNVLENRVEGELITPVGFGNFYPSFSDDGSKMVYVSNKYSDYFGVSSIYLYDFKTKKEKLLVPMVRSTAVFIPGSNKIIYAKLSDDNPRWNNIHDLYLYDLDEEESTRLTHGLRANNPNVSHDGSKIVFLFQKDGTTNIGTVDINGKNFKQLTFFNNGEQVYNPKFSPDDSYIVFGYSLKNTREIARVDTNGTGYDIIIQNGYDNRDPVFDSNGNLIFASDMTGIFNLYRYDFETQKTTRISNVVGGAFQPDIDGEGNVIYAGYTSDGFKIFLLDKESQSKVDDDKKYVWIGNPPLGNDKPKGDLARFNIERLKNYNDYELPDVKPSRYSGYFSRFSIIPFIRYDNYITSNSFADRIKPGIYAASSDYLNRFSIFGGGAINKKFERDLFLSFEYRDKLPLLFNLGLKPEVGIELYSVSRKTNTDIIFDSLDTSLRTSTDVTYNLFEADFFARQKIITAGNMLEFRYVYSSYTATLEAFIFPNTSLLYPSTNDTYYIGNDFQLKFSHDGIIPTKDADINPVGRKIELKYDYEFNRYNPDGTYEVADGILKPVYKNYNFQRIELNWKEYMRVYMEHTLTAQIRAGSILGPDVPEFFDFYLGGLIGMKSYPFYAVSGNEVAWINLTYRFPLFKDIDTRLGHLYVDKIYMSVYADFGNAWNGNSVKLNDFKKGAGLELRIKMNSFYLFPTSLFLNAAYSFDRFTRTILNENVTYGKEWNFYGGILFDFNF
ncbi:WD40 domain-containing protein [Melioribacter roseus P3M-2]|uniref:WD40 domain-containing protein n=1 Tax=Melioribacter roseus (strain DSM 23840 / JCM 17771 / VKM B-2668 / P3M-2) TaxID=1191523 RepID=I7A1M2_MELRP|nr:PD40 domain-containing protein [Melioribacter roseus]AFN75123.1 WD40 domain-containing protein [Melioribacter roseus P3M-2]